MIHKHRRSDRGRRGITMVLVVLSIVVLVAVGVAILVHTIGATVSTGGVIQKTDAFNAADAGLNQAIAMLDPNVNAAGPPCDGSTINSVGTATYTCNVGLNNLKPVPPGTTKTGMDECTKKTATIPPLFALVCGTGKSILGRTSMVEALVTYTPGFNFPPGAINAEFQIHYFSNLPVFDSSYPLNTANDASVTANNQLIAGPGTTIPQGKTFGACTVNACPVQQGTPPPDPCHTVSDKLLGSDGAVHCGKPYIAQLPTSFDVTRIVSGAKLDAKLGPPSSHLNGADVGGTTNDYPLQTYYINGNVTFANGTTSTFDNSSGDGIVFIIGNVDFKGSATLVSPTGVEFFVTGTLTSAGNSGALGNFGIQSPFGKIFVLGVDSAGTSLTLGGNSTQNVGLLYTPYGDLVIQGNALIHGAVDAGQLDVPGVASIKLGGGGVGGALFYIPAVTGPPGKDGLLQIISYIES